MNTMNFPKTKALCIKRIKFFDEILKLVIDKKRRNDFEYEKHKWERCLNLIINKTVIDKKTERKLLIKHFVEKAIKPYLQFQKKMRQNWINGYEQRIKTTNGNFVDCTDEYKKILFIYNNCISEAESCLIEIK